MILKGKVHKFGDDINTDDIIAAQYLVTIDAKELGRHCMETIRSDFSSKVKPGDIIELEIEGIGILRNRVGQKPPNRDFKR